MRAPIVIFASFAVMSGATIVEVRESPRSVLPRTGATLLIDRLPVKTTMQRLKKMFRYLNFVQTPGKLYTFAPNPMIVLAWLLILSFSFCGQVFSENIKDYAASNPRERDEELLCGRSSPLWHYYFWNKLSKDTLTDPKRRTLILAYQARRWQPFFFDSRFQMSKDAASLMGRLDRLKDDAIDPAPYQLEKLQKRIADLKKLQSNLQCVNPDPHSCMIEPLAQSFNQLPLSPSTSDSTADDTSSQGPLHPPQYAPGAQLSEKHRALFQAASEIDIELMYRLMRYAKDMDPFCQPEIDKVLSGQVAIAKFLSKVEPGSWQYAAVRQAYAKYQQLALKHPFKSLALPKLQLGDKGPGVKQLQERLAEEGYYQGKAQGDFDAATKQALERFQTAHMLNPDGVVGGETRLRLNDSYEQKLKMIAYSLKMLRASQTRRYDRYIRVNIPQYSLEYWKQDQISKTYRVIVGKATGKKVKLQGKMIGVNQTPTLVSAIQQVIVNPRWYVTDRIRLELDDQFRADPAYFAKNGYVAMSSSYPWGSPRIFQKPGPNNPLGRVKFEFPNAYAIFLHDTPKRDLFARMPRDFSHGCIRLDNALNFAQVLLTDDQNPKAEEMQKSLASERQVFFPLQQPVPIIVEYIPVSASTKDQVIFCGDPYRWLSDDQKVKS